MKRSQFACLILLGLAFAVGCGSKAPQRNQTQGIASPSGKYLLYAPIEPQTTDPRYDGYTAWTVTITDVNGQVLYRDEDSKMLGHFSIYWGWDDQDRAWVYNSDDGRIWRWEQTSEGWKKIESRRNDGTPDWVLPDYAR